MNATEIWNLASSIVSVVLGILAIVLSIYFFVQSKNAEKATSCTLTKIETQADALQKLNAKWMDRLTRYVTEDRPNPADPAIPQLITVLSQLPLTLTTTLTQSSDKKTMEELQNELLTAYISLYFYTAQTNCWSQLMVPPISEFDKEKHSLVKRIVDMSDADFQYIANILAKYDSRQLQIHSLSHLLNETKDVWRNEIRSTEEVFVAAEKRNT